MSPLSVLRTLGFNLFKGFLVSISAFIGMMVGSMLATLVGLPAPEIPPQADMAVLMPLMFLSVSLVAIFLGQCYRRLYRRWWQRTLAIWLSNYILYSLLNTLDGMLFSPLPNMSTNIFSALFTALFTAALAAWLWKPAILEAPSARTFSVANLAWRMVVAWLAFPPLYYGMGLLVAPFTAQYYQDNSLNLGLTLPSIDTLMAMQVLRGGLFLLAVLPVLFAHRGSRLSVWLWVGGVIFIQIAASPIIQGHWLPLAVRLPHAVELLVDSFLQAGIYVMLLVPSSQSVANRLVRPAYE